MLSRSEKNSRSGGRNSLVKRRLGAAVGGLRFVPAPEAREQNVPPER